jgi:anaerobic magnesium-protoporphyrin IX monomethyl ester cyclase
MLSILICHSYYLRFDPKQLERGKPYPPLATLEVAALLRESGHRVALFDSMLSDDPAEYLRMLREVRPQLVVLYEDNFNYLSKMCLARMRRAACEMIAAARGIGARVIAAGSDETDEPEPYLRSGADVVLIGEGLPALEELVARLDADPVLGDRDALAGVPGTARLVGAGVERTTGAAVRRRASRPASPAWDLVGIERYRAIWQRAHGYFSLNMAASRGCSFRCAWCAKPIWGNRYLQRDPVEVAAEMAHLEWTFAPDHIWFTDDIFGFRVDWVRRFAGARREHGSSVPFTIQTRADLVSGRMAAALREAGCREAWLGAESGSQRVLDAMNKGTRVADLHDARARLKAEGIRVGFFIQLGYLGEELEDILATRELIETAQPDDVGVSVSYPLPGTRFYELVSAQLGEKTHWQESDDLAMMFWGTYRSDFYRAVRDLLHEQVSLQRRAERCRPPVEGGTADELAMRWRKLIGRERQFRQHRAP